MLLTITTYCCFACHVRHTLPSLQGRQNACVTSQATALSDFQIKSGLHCQMCASRVMDCLCHNPAYTAKILDNASPVGTNSYHDTRTICIQAGSVICLGLCRVRHVSNFLRAVCCRPKGFFQTLLKGTTLAAQCGLQH